MSYGHQRILIVDDDEELCALLETLLRDPGRALTVAHDAHGALALAQAQRFDVVVSDLHFGDELSGLDVLRAFKSVDPQVEVVLVTGFGSLQTAIEAVRAGAFDYISKPFSGREVQETVARALKRRARSDQPAEAPQFPGLPSEGLIGRSRGMLAVYKQIAHASTSDVPVLITGDTGTGKELVAKAIHRNSQRAGHPFVAVNCGALAETLLESELFGHVRGSFTGAVSDKKGLFEQAQGGVIFLDEIGDTTAAFQVRLLRTLEEGEVRPVGASRVVKVDVRVLAATNRDLQRACEEGDFRRDLFFRLNVIQIHAPPLRERTEDVALLVSHFLHGVAKRVGGLATVTPEAMERLVAHSWPGNVRELENCIERLALAARGGTIDVDDLSGALRDAEPAGAAPAPGPDNLIADMPTLEVLEGRYLQHVLRAVKGRRSRAAKVLGVDRRTLYRMVERHGLSAEPEVEDES